jgi:hypothetical protein
MDDGSVTQHSHALTLPRIGINRTHSLEEFKTLNSPSNIWLRQFIKSIFFKAPHK